jgi:hypothetical protein
LTRGQQPPSAQITFSCFHDTQYITSFPPSTPPHPTQLMDNDNSQTKMAAASVDKVSPWIAAQLTTPAIDPNSQVTPSSALMFHPDSLIYLLVGPEEQKMVVHEIYLSRDSSFFKAALKKQWNEGQTRVIKLPEESRELMQYYIGHLYGAKLPTHDLSAGIICTLKDKHYGMLADLYVLAERMLDAKYQNAIIREFFRLVHLVFGPPETKSRYYPVGEAVNNIIYGGTTLASPARRMLVDWSTSHGSKSWLNGVTNPEYLLDLSKALFEKLLAQKSVNDFRLVHMKVEDYLVCEDA